MAFASAFAPYAAYFYRLRGPKAWIGAREAVLTIEDRIVRVRTHLMIVTNMIGDVTSDYIVTTFNT